MSVILRPLEPYEYPPRIRYVEGVTNYGGGCQHRHNGHPGLPCGNSGKYMLGDEKLCWPHAAQKIRALMFKRVPVEVREASRNDHT